MRPFGYNPENYNGKIWWNEDNPEMRAIWGTQSDYDKHVAQGGSWSEYEEKAKKRAVAMESLVNENPGRSKTK